MDWLSAYGVQIMHVLTSIIAVASAISMITPGDSDNKIVEKLKWVVDFLALNVFHAKTEK